MLEASQEDLMDDHEWAKIRAWLASHPPFAAWPPLLLAFFGFWMVIRNPARDCNIRSMITTCDSNLQEMKAGISIIEKEGSLIEYEEKRS